MKVAEDLNLRGLIRMKTLAFTFFCLTLPVSSYCQSAVWSANVSSGMVIPFVGVWNSAQIGRKVDVLRIIGGYEFARYDKIELQYLESRKYAAWLDNAFLGVEYPMRRSNFELAPSFSVFTGQGLVKFRYHIWKTNCVNCSENQSDAFFYKWSRTRGFRLALSGKYYVLKGVNLGFSAVLYPVISTPEGIRGRAAGALLFSIGTGFGRIEPKELTQ